MSLPGVQTGRPRGFYDVVIIGAGVQGLATAYELARRGVTNVAVLDQAWPGGGASGRNGEMIRSAFDSREWSRLFDVSLRRFADLSAELDFNVLFNPAGYMILASTEAEESQLESIKASNERDGIDTVRLGRTDVLAAIPSISPNLVRGGILQPDGGFAHHDAVVWGYLRAAARAGVSVFADVHVRDILVSSGGRAMGVRTGSDDIRAGTVVNAGGGDSLRLNETVGVRLPLVQARLEMLVTEPLKPFLTVAVASPHLLGYCHQTTRGEFVGGTELPRTDETSSVSSTYRMLRGMATTWVRLFPALAGARILRSWAGTVTQAPDLAPVLGRAPNIDGYWLSIGWVYGFMGAPAAGSLLAEAITTGTIPDVMAPFDAERLLEQRWIRESTLVVASEEGS